MILNENLVERMAKVGREAWHAAVSTTGKRSWEQMNLSDKHKWLAMARAILEASVTPEPRGK